MPSFDIVSEVDKHELTNANDQANRELPPRFDFKGSDATFELVESELPQIPPTYPPPNPCYPSVAPSPSAACP